ncbi:transcriptional repressor protein YY1 [Episyrphus balteatus]|uniref:transcriptional repressor protein YY1 n=1 Tax=Episyrphus balteatus TaxID=286459 RepID=UPI002485EA70|nr:transcriptional repressor protein YY1 [Episyrphus balteatus]
MDQKLLSKSHDLQENELVFFTEDDIPLCVDAENFLVYDCKEDSQNANFANDVEVLTEAVGEQQAQNVLSTPPKIPKYNDHVKKPAKRWCQKEVCIKTIESEFKVVMWVQDDSDQSDHEVTEPTVKRKPRKIKQEPQVEQNFEISDQSHENNLPSIKCTIKSCRMLFKDVTKLRQHISQHCLDQPNVVGYLCTFENCPKVFKSISSLRKHMHTHGPKTKVCAECGKAFIDNSKLNRHLVVHTGDKPFQCTFEGCGKRFSLDFNLRTHARIHTGYRPFACTFDGCTKRFAQSTNLKSHQLIHLKNAYKFKDSDK